jgi:hypothetical protein
MNKNMSTQETRVDDTAVRGSVRRFALPLIGGILALSLAACETRSNSSGGGLTSSLFGSDEQTASAPQGQNAQTAAARPISFAPIIGAPATISTKMSQELVAAAGTKGLKIESGDSGYTVRGYLVAASAQTGTKLSYIWDIRDQNGQRAERFQGDELIEGKKGGDPWALVDDVAIKRIAASTADKISTWMYGAANTASPQPEANTASAPPQQQVALASAQPVQQPAPQQIAAQEPPPQQASVNVATAEPVSTGEIVAVVQPVTGAPGDGEQSLTSAMRKHLASAGVKLTEQASGSVYTVRGTVELGAADGGQQPITIRWLVVDPNGAQIDKAVVQRNRIPAGSLDGPWGQVADLAASEAAKSVAKLIRPTG